MSKTFRFDNSRYISDWATKTQSLEMGSFLDGVDYVTGIQVKKGSLGEDNKLYNVTLTKIGDTEIVGGVKSTDWDRGSYSFCKSADVQEVMMDLGSGGEIYLKKLLCYLYKQDASWNTITISISSNGTDWIVVPHTRTEDILTVALAYPGMGMQYVKFKFTQATETVITDIQGFQSEYILPFQYVDHTSYLSAATLTGVTAVVSEPGTTQAKIQILKNGVAYYWDGVSAWKESGSDSSVWDQLSCTVAEANTNIASLITHADTKQFKPRLILIPTATATPSCSSITLVV